MKGFSWKGPRYSPIALDVSPGQVHLLQLKEAYGATTVSAAEAVSLPREGDRDAMLYQAIRKCLSMGSFRGRRAAICLKQEDLFVQHQRMAMERQGDAMDRIRKELRRNIPFDIDRAELRYIKTGKVYERSEVREELILMIAAREVLDRYFAILHELKLMPVAVGAEPLALTSAALRFPPPGASMQGSVGLMHIAPEETQLIVIRKGRLAFTRPIPVGGQRFTRAIGEKLDIDSESAARLKRAIGTGEHLNDTLKSAAHSAVRPVLEEIFSEVLSCFRYFSSVFNREAVDFVLVTGEESGGIVDLRFMESRIGVPVFPWDIRTVCGGDSDDQRIDYSFTPVVGLALECLDTPAEAVDFVPRDVMEQRRRRRSMLLRVVSLLALILFMVLIYHVTDRRTKKLQQMRDMAESRCSLIDMKSEAVQKLRSKEKAFAEKKYQLLLARPLVRVSRIVAEIARAAGPGVTLTSLKLHNAVPANNPGADGEAESQGRRAAYYFVISLQGLARSSEDVSRFVEGLSLSKAFASIRDEGFEDSVIENRPVKNFKLTLTVGGEVDYEEL